MVVLGLTGSIGMGKTATAAMFRRAGVPVLDADAVVHRLLGGGAVERVEAAFPGVVRDGAVDRAALGKLVFDDPPALCRLEAILHPMVRAAEGEFLGRASRRGAALVVLDIPLLFETGGARRCDAVCVVSAPRLVQRRRVLVRPGMTEATFEAIDARQLADAVKRRRADFLVPTGLGRAFSLRRVRAIIETARRMPPRQWPRRPATRRFHPHA